MSDREKTIGIRLALKDICSKTDFLQNQQYVHTPYELCGEMVGALLDAMLSEPTLVTPPTEQTFLTINLEFVEVLCYDVGVKKANVWFVTDCPQKAKILAHPRYQGVNVVLADYLSWEGNNMKFDVIAGNPPYNKPCDVEGAGFGGRNTLWEQFVTKSLSLLKPSGFLCYIHPPRWRKPEDDTWKELTSKQLCFIKILGEDEGKKVFGVGTRADWYILKNVPPTKLTTIIDETGKQHSLDLSKQHFLPNALIGEIDTLLASAGEEKCEVIYSSSNYETRRDWMSKEQQKSFKHPCVHSLNSDEHGGMICWYSSRNDNGHFGVPKVIINDGRHTRPINDFKGKFGMTNHCFGISISSEKEGDLIVAAINTLKFQEIIKATKWTSFGTEWRMFKYFRRDFYKQFVDANGNAI